MKIYKLLKVKTHYNFNNFIQNLTNIHVSKVLKVACSDTVWPVIDLSSAESERVSSALDMVACAARASTAPAHSDGLTQAAQHVQTRQDVMFGVSVVMRSLIPI